MKSCCLTGANGYLGRLLTARLAREKPAVSVCTIDLAAAPPLNGVAAHQADIRSPALHDIFAAEKPDVVVHLAFYTHPEGDAREAASVNLEGTRNIAAAAAAAGVRRFVLVSSAAAYGSHADNPLPLSEEHALRPNEFFYYSKHKAEQEQIVQDIFKDQPATALVILRPAAVIGPHINNPTGDALRGALLFYPSGKAPPIQLIDEDDAVEAFCRAALGETAGVFNVGADGVLTYPDFARLLNKRMLRLPFPLLAALATAGKRLGLSPVSATTLRFIRHPIVMDTSRFHRVFAFTPRRDTLAAFTRFAASL